MKKRWKRRQEMKMWRWWSKLESRIIIFDLLFFLFVI